MYLVEKGFYEEVEIVFYVKGHTKNCCDRLFKVMKGDYHKSQIMTFDHPGDDNSLVKVLDRHQDVNVVPIKFDEGADFFRQWDKYEDKLYKSFPSGTMKQNHVFRVRKVVGETVFEVLGDDSEAPHGRFLNLKKRGVDGETRQNIPQNEMPEPSETPGLKPIKQAELYFKWRPMVHTDFQDYTCPKPPDEVLQKIQGEKRDKARKRASQAKNNSNKRQRRVPDSS